RFVCHDNKTDMLFYQIRDKISIYNSLGQELNTISLPTEQPFYGCIRKFKDFVISFEAHGYFTLFDLQEVKTIFKIQVTKFDAGDWDKWVWIYSFDYPLIIYGYGQRTQNL